MRASSARILGSDNILAREPLHDARARFAPQRSILTNARNHVGRDVVINLDLKDFFPTLTYARVKGLFEALAMPKRRDPARAVVHRACCR